MRTEWRAFYEEAKSRDILEEAKGLGARLRKVGSAEWEGPCPACGGTDRFSVNTRKQVYNCRSSGDGGGDIIQMVEHCTGCSTVEAAEKLTGRARPDRSRDETIEERNDRLKRNAERLAALREREALEERQAALKAQRDERKIAEVIALAEPIHGTYGWRYLVETRGLEPSPPLVTDIRFVPELDYWGLPDTGLNDPVLLASLPAVVAIIRDFSGAVMGVSQTYLDPHRPEKWQPTGSPRNKAKKVRGIKKHGMIRLGRIGETLAISEGWENALAWSQLGGGLHIEDLSLAAAVDLGNLAGGATGSIPHPWMKNNDGQRVQIANGVPDPTEPGVILPEGVKSVILICDANSEQYATAAKYATAAQRFRNNGMEVLLAWPEGGRRDWNDALLAEAPAKVRTA